VFESDVQKGRAESKRKTVIEERRDSNDLMERVIKREDLYLRRRAGVKRTQI